VFIKKSNSASDTILGVISAKLYLWRRRGAKMSMQTKAFRTYRGAALCREALAYVAEKREVSSAAATAESSYAYTGGYDYH
jgi:hypothetical protein